MPDKQALTLFNIINIGKELTDWKCEILKK